MTIAVLRRWYVFLPLITLSAAGAYVVGQGVKPQYEVTATSILVPGMVEAEEATNPYGGMDNTTDVIVIVLGAPHTREALADRGLDPTYEVDTRSRTSIMDVTVLSATEQQATATAAALLEIAEQELADRQEGVPERAQIKLQVLSEPALTDVVSEGKMRNMAVVGVVGAALSLLVTLLFDDLLGLFRRARARKRQKGPADEVATQETGADDAPRQPPAQPQEQLTNGQVTLEPDPPSRSRRERATSRGQA